METLTEFLYRTLIEGNCQQVPRQVNDLIKLTTAKDIKVMEIGFNAGHSAEVFLKNNPTLTLTSFDLGHHTYVNMGKSYIDAYFPNRHNLILGDSTITVPKFIGENNGAKFDVIFIDGGHDYHIAKQDMQNCFYLSHKDTIVIMDDTIYTNGWQQEWTIGPTIVWNEYLNENKIIELNRVDYQNGRGMSWGKYVM